MFGVDYFAKKVIEYAFLFLSLLDFEYGFNKEQTVYP